LFTFLREREKLPLSLVKNFINQIIDGLDILHNQLKIAHLDLKLENILIEEVSNNSNEETQYKLKICDFGFSHSKISNIMIIRGSEGYKSPEIY